MMPTKRKRSPEPKPTGQRAKQAAKRLASAAQEQAAYAKLLREHPQENAGELIAAAAKGTSGLLSSRQELDERVNQQLVAALRLALALSRNPKKIDAFFEDPFWEGQKPNSGKLLLRCLQFAMPPQDDNERKLLSKHAAAITWLVIKGYNPDNLARGIKKEGGRSKCAEQLATWRAEQKPKAVVAKKGAVQQGQGVAQPDSARLPIRYVKSLRQIIRERRPPADQQYFWARVHHHGDRIVLTRIERGPKHLSGLQK